MARHKMVASLVCARCGKSLKQLVNAPTPEFLVECNEIEVEAEDLRHSASVQPKPAFSPKTATASSELTTTVDLSVETAKTQ